MKTKRKSITINNNSPSRINKYKRMSWEGIGIINNDANEINRTDKHVKTHLNRIDFPHLALDAGFPRVT